MGVAEKLRTKFYDFRLIILLKTDANGTHDILWTISLAGVY